MELLYEWLWKACSWILLSFLVERLISLLVCLRDDVSVSGFVKEKEIKPFSVVDHDEDVQSDQFRIGVYNNKKEVESVDRVNESVEYQQVDFGVISSELKLVDSIKSDEVILKKEFNQYLAKGFDEYNKEIEGKEKGENNKEKGGKFGKNLVDQIEREEEKYVGFEDKFDWKLESGKTNVDVHIRDDVNMGVKDRECDEIDGENSSNVHKGEISGRKLSKDEGVLSDDEEWEGIERSELEKKFAKAMNLVECKDKEGKLLKGGNDVNMQLYGLQKVAIEGPCHEPQPMALKLSARAKWNAWQRLGNMTREDAMEQYIKLLSDNTFEGVEDDHSLVQGKSSSSGTAVDSCTGAN
ncbi:Acyl-CoA-binding domain-containing protein 3 [Bienertia sinuspersici]